MERDTADAAEKAGAIVLRHAARNREGFARGALKAAQWVVRKTGFFEFGDILFEELEGSRKPEAISVALIARPARARR